MLNLKRWNALSKEWIIAALILNEIKAAIIDRLIRLKYVFTF